jgi:Ca2+-binding RTX toxin-like protein
MPASDPQLTIMRKNALDELASLENQLAEDSLAQAWQKDSSGSNIINYRIVGDPVSSYLKEPQVGEDITILNANGNAENTTVMLEAMNANSLAGEIANLGFHFMDNFSIENLMSSGKDITVKDSLAINSDALFELAELFKDKTKFEIDQTGAGSIKIGQKHELYVGFGNKWTPSGDDRSQLVTMVHDSIYANAGYKSSGSLSQVQMMVERIQAQFVNNKYFYVKSIESPDLQTYVLIAPKDPTIDPNTNNYLTNAESWRPPRDPLAIDLDGDGIETVSQNAGIIFDTDADGLKTGTSWLKGDDGWLVLDKNNNGKIDNGSELFGDAYVKKDQTKAKDAYDVIGDIDSNHDGMITAADAKFAELKIWQDKNQNGISESNELKTLGEIGLVELKVGRTSSSATNLGNGVVTNGGSTTVINGVEQQTGALNLSQNTFYREFTDKLDTSSVADLPNLVGSGLVRDLREAMTLSAELTQDVRTYMSSNVTERSKMLDELASDWAATSTLSTSKNRHTEAHTDFYFSGIDSSSNPNAQSEMLDKLALVEKFNGRRINAGNESQTVIYQRDAYGNVLRDVNGSPLVNYIHTNVSFNDAQTSWILQSYNSITNSIDKGLSVYTDVLPFLASTNLAITETNDLLLDISKILQNLDMGIAPEQTVAKIIGLTSFLNESVNSLVSAVEQQALVKWIDHKVNVENLDVGKYINDWVYNKGNTSNNDVIFYRDTKNIISGLSGDDVVLAMGGDDEISGGVGNETIYGGFGKDILSGNDGNDVLIGENDEDQMYGGNGDDQIYGGSGNDYLNGGFGYNYLNGGDGNDTLIASTEDNWNNRWDRHRSNTLEGGRGDDYLQGHVAADTYIYNKGDGKDTIEDIGVEWFGGSALNNKYGNRNDIIQFGAGITKDDLQIIQFGDSLLINIGTSGEDSITISNYFVDANRKIEEIRFVDDSSLNLGLYVTENVAFHRDGSNGNDTLTGLNTRDELFGLGGDDKISGGAGRDILNGGGGNDTLPIFI